MKKSMLIFIIILLGDIMFAQAKINAGFVPGQIWFSKIPFFETENIRIYTVVYNSSDADIIGNVEFFDNDILLKSVEFSMAQGTGVRDIWIDYLALGGEHKFIVKIVNARKISDNGSFEAVDFGAGSQVSVIEFIDGDNDSDYIGNKEDEDDDNDGVKDINEIENGTNPFLADQPMNIAEDATTTFQKNNTQIKKIGGKAESVIIAALQKHTPEQAINFLSSANNFFDSQVENINAKKENLRQDLYDSRIEEKDDNPTELLSSTISTIILSATNTQLQSFAAEDNMTKEIIIKQNITEKINRLIKWLYYYFLVIIGFLIGHKILLFFVIFLMIYFVLKRIIRFYL